MASIKKQPNGMYRARYRDDAGKEHARHFDKKSDGQDWLDSITASVVRGEYVDPRRARVTVGPWAAEYLAGRVHLKPKTLAGYHSLLTTCVLPTWSDVSLAKISNADVVAWVASMRASGLSPSRVRQAYHLLSAMLDAAVRDRRLPSNPAAGVDLPRLRRKEHRYLDHGQVAALAEACGPYRVLVATLAYTGLRFGEAAALRVKRVDLLRGRLRITEAMTEVNGVAVFGSPKTHQHRNVPVPAFLRDQLARHLAGARACRRCSATPPPPSPSTGTGTSSATSWTGSPSASTPPSAGISRTFRGLSAD
jgi:integrase